MHKYISNYTYTCIKPYKYVCTYMYIYKYILFLNVPYIRKPQVIQDPTHTPLNITSKIETRQLPFAGYRPPPRPCIRRDNTSITIAATTVVSVKLEYGPGTIQAGFPSSLGFEVGGQSYSNFLAATVLISELLILLLLEY